MVEKKINTVQIEDLIELYHEDKDKCELYCHLLKLNIKIIEYFSVNGFTLRRNSFTVIDLLSFIEDHSKFTSKEDFELFMNECQSVKYLSEFSHIQCEVLIMCLHFNLDLSTYDPNIFSNSKFKSIYYLARENRFFTKKEIKEYSDDKFMLISLNLSKGIDITHLDPHTYSYMHMQMVAQFLEKGKDFSKFDPQKYSVRMIQLLEEELETSTNISHIDPNVYDFEQMREVIRCLNLGKDFTHLDPKKFTYLDMKEIRMQLESESHYGKN